LALALVYDDAGAVGSPLIVSAEKKKEKIILRLTKRSG